MSDARELLSRVEELMGEVEARLRGSPLDVDAQLAKVEAQLSDEAKALSPADVALLVLRAQLYSYRAAVAPGKEGLQ